MMNCPMCGQAAHTRSSFQISNETKERYNQCTNIECGHTFVTHETFCAVSMPSAKNQRSATSSQRYARTICLLNPTRYWRGFFMTNDHVQSGRGSANLLAVNHFG